MSSDFAIKIEKLSKCYQIYDSPRDRLKQFVVPRILRFTWLAANNYFREFWALRDISFTIKKGETVGVIGKNGSGKSTLLQIICGTLHPTSGMVETNGRIGALLELGSGFDPEFTGRENVYMNATLLGLSKKQIDNKFEDIASFADIGDFIEQPVKTYSSGMVVRLAFAVVAHVDADILVIDEALSVGDAFFVQKCMRFLRQFMEKGTVLFVSHDSGAILNLCQRAILLQDGEMTAQGKPKEIMESYLEKLYEDQQGGSVGSEHRNLKQPVVVEASPRDMRLDFINQTVLRNDIELFPFSSDAANFGKGGAQIINVQLLDIDENELSWIVGGERVKLVVTCVAQDDLYSPIIGFQVKDRLGQVVFADNTYLTYIKNPINIIRGEHFRAYFNFEMPLLPVGDYAVATAIAEGTQEEHVQHHWVHEAIAFKAHSSIICHGLIGVPMTNIEIVKI